MKLGEATQSIKEDVKSVSDRLNELCELSFIDRIRTLKDLKYVWPHITTQSKEIATQLIGRDEFSVGAWTEIQHSFAERGYTIKDLKELFVSRGSEYKHGRNYAKLFIRNNWK